MRGGPPRQDGGPNSDAQNSGKQPWMPPGTACELAPPAAAAPAALATSAEDACSAMLTSV
eukprot:374420-Alexandrium_andersonii.AAC.1